jgi:methylmalonyl-CoA/ethylmalonyl-CoA epimerase
MKLGRLNHIGIASPSIANSIVHSRDVMGPCINPDKTL